MGNNKRNGRDTSSKSTKRAKNLSLTGDTIRQLDELATADKRSPSDEVAWLIDEAAKARALAS